MPWQTGSLTLPGSAYTIPALGKTLFLNIDGHNLFNTISWSRNGISHTNSAGRFFLDWSWNLLDV